MHMFPVQEAEQRASHVNNTVINDALSKSCVA